MKFLCVSCDEPLQLQKTSGPEAGGLSLIFHCPSCGRDVAMLTNTAETQLVHSLGVRVGSSEAPVAPLAQLRAHLGGVRSEALTEDQAPEPTWTAAAEARLVMHPHFVQPIIRRTYADYARQHGLPEITPEVMDAARNVLGKG